MAPKLNSTIKIKNKSDTIFIIYLIQMVLALIFMKWNLNIRIFYWRIFLSEWFKFLLNEIITSQFIQKHFFFQLK